MDADLCSNMYIVKSDKVESTRKARVNVCLNNGNNLYFKKDKTNQKYRITLRDCRDEAIYTISEDGKEDIYEFNIDEKTARKAVILEIVNWSTNAENFESFYFSIGYNVPQIKEYKKHNKNTQRMIGAIFYDGWRLKWDNETYSEKSQQLYESSSIYDSNFPDWREKFKHENGFYPTEQMSFSISYPNEVANIHDENGNLYPLLPSRKPIAEYNGVNLGWLNTSTQEQIDAQIDMASKYGIDYFAFVTGFSSKYFEDGVLNKQSWLDDNPSIVRFLNSPNKFKMKFCLINTFSPKSMTGSENVAMRAFIYEFMQDEQYLYVDGRPILIEYICSNNSESDGILEPYCHLKNIALITSGYDGYGSDGKTAYSAYIPYYDNGVTFEEKHYSELKEYNYAKILEKYHGGIQLFPVSAGRALSARSDFKYNVDFEAPTKNELLTAIKETIDYTENFYERDKIIMLYAWNEFAEGGWLMPTQNEIDSGLGYYRLEAILDAKEYWRNILN